MVDRCELAPNNTAWLYLKTIRAMASRTRHYPYTLAQSLTAATNRFSRKVEFLTRYDPEAPKPYELLFRLREHPAVGGALRFETPREVEAFLARASPNLLQAELLENALRGELSLNPALMTQP